MNEMQDLPIEYLQGTASQLIFISVFLGGISATILGTLIIVKNDRKVFSYILFFLSLAAVAFIVSVFGINKLQIVLTPGSPYDLTNENLFLPRLVGALSLFVGIYALLTTVALFGWLRSKKMGIITTVLSIIAGFLIFLMT